MSARLVMKLEVVEVNHLPGGVRRCVLRHPRRPTLPPPEPGSHVDVRLSDGRVRQYSLCGDPDDASRYVIAIRREDTGRGGSLWLHEHLFAGTVAHVSAPRNHFALAADATHHLLIGGGIGITPLVAMAWYLQRRGASFSLHLLARDATHAAFLDELQARHGECISAHLSREQKGGRFDAAAALAACPAGTHVYCCGPRRLTDAVRATAWPEERLHLESFVPMDDGQPPAPFELVLARSGLVLPVPAERSALEVLREAGLLVPSSCGIGVCGTCECAVIDGEVLHRDVVLDGAARRRAMLPCVSRAVGRVTLDL
jgi:vanillate O-demethylase ferredoxin subunit